MAKSTLRFHSLADIFPLLNGSEFEKLTDSVAESGLREPIRLYEGKILDGRNRYRACLAAGVEPWFEEYTGDDPLAYVIDLNVLRRHLNESQRAMVAARLAQLAQGRPKTGQLAGLGLPSQSQAAGALNVGERTVRRAKVVQDSGTQKLASAVDGGLIPVSHGARLAHEPSAVQDAVADKVAAGKPLKDALREIKQEAQAAVPANLPHIGKRFRLIHSDIRDLDVEAGSVDAIVCDPPYPREYLNTFACLAERAPLWLKPGGSLLVMSGQSWLPDVLARLSAGPLRYQWTLAYLTPGGQAVQIFDRKVNTFWKPVFWFVKGSYTGSWVGDVAASKVNDNDKRFHHWGQSESGMADLIERISLPGQTILDPFCGGGTTGVVAVHLNRLFIGADISKDALNTTAHRLREVSHAVAA